MRSIIAIIVALAASAAVAQSAPTDAEIEAAFAVCSKPEALAPLGPGPALGQKRKFNAGFEFCDKIHAERGKRAEAANAAGAKASAADIAKRLGQ